MKRIITATMLMLISATNLNSQTDDMYFSRGSSSNRDYIRRHSAYLNERRSSGNYQNAQPSQIVYVPQQDVVFKTDTVYIQDSFMSELQMRLSQRFRNSGIDTVFVHDARVSDLLEKMTELESRVGEQKTVFSNEDVPVTNEQFKPWLKKYTMGDCLKKSGNCQYSSLGVLAFGGIMTTAFVYAYNNDHGSSDGYKYAAIGTGIATGVVSFVFYLNSIKWKIRAGKKSNVELQMRGTSLVLNF